jgi:hypothetical protein
MAALLLATTPAPAATPSLEEQYLGIYYQIQQADSFNANGQPARALAKYKEAQTNLATFQHAHPDWNTKMLSFRQSYLSDKIASLAQPASSAAESGGGAIAAPAQVKLLEAGAEPRKALRLHPAPGDKQSVTMTTKIGMDISAGEKQQAVKLPSMTLTLEATVKSVSANGDIAYETVISDMSAAEAPESGETPDAMKTAMDSIKGVKGAETMSNRGLTKSSSMKLPAASADPQVRAAFSQLLSGGLSGGIPLPEEPIGPGAKWEVKRHTKAQGISQDHTSTYELVAIEGERLTVKTTATRQAPVQKIQNPAMRGMQVEVTKLTGSGDGSMTFDLTKVMPLEAAMDMQVTTVMDMSIGGQTQSMTTKMDQSMKLEAK